MAQQVDSTVNEHPPEVRVLTLAEQIDAGLDADLGTALGQFRELIVGQAAEQADSSKLVGFFAKESDVALSAYRWPHFHGWQNGPKAGKPGRTERARKSWGLARS